MTDSQQTPYVDCIKKQLEEVDMLSSIFCTPGELNIFDPGVITDFNRFLNSTEKNPERFLKARLDFTITLKVFHVSSLQKLEIRVELPHLYPLFENAIVVLHSALLTKAKEQYFKTQIENYISTVDKSDVYIYQVISWIRDKIEEIINRDANQFKETKSDPADDIITFERLWIYSHHIKSKIKRQEIMKQSRYNNLSGFCRPGKPGIICVEGLQKNVQEFWRIIKGMQWQKIGICKSEVQHKRYKDLDKLRRFNGFKEQLFWDDEENQESIMNKSLFMKYLDDHKSGYIKKELFGFF